MTGPGVTLVVEGDTDIPFATKLASRSGLTIAKAIDTGGKSKLDKGLAGWNRAAQLEPWLVLRDLDNDAPCAPVLTNHLLPDRNQLFQLRIAVRSLEAWILADSEALSAFLRVRATLIPMNVEAIAQPKRFLIDLARKSTKPSVRAAMVPAKGGVRPTGPRYEASLIEFGLDHWDVDRAQKCAPSLARAVRSLSNMAASLTRPR